MCARFSNSDSKLILYELDCIYVDSDTVMDVYCHEVDRASDINVFNCFSSTIRVLR